jgi:hypothetical protein
MVESGEVCNLAIDSEPTTYNEAVGASDGDKWMAAINDEYASLMENKTWTLTPLPKGRKAIGCKWVFRVKRNADGSIEKYKARLCAKGYSQVKGLDFNETFAPVAKFSSLRILLSIAAVQDLEVHHMDVKCAFLNGDLEEEIYMQQPEGFIEEGKESLVCKLQRSLYGLKQSPRAWNQKLDAELKELGFMRSEADHSLYIHFHEHDLVFVIVYVDDMLILSNSIPQVQALKRNLERKFKMTDLGEATFFLGMEIKRDREHRTMQLSQRRYVNDILKRFNMESCKPVGTPIATKTKLKRADDEETTMDRSLYQSAVGSLMYLMVSTRPDIAYSVGAVSQFMANPMEDHYMVVKRIFRYLQGTAAVCLELGGEQLLVEGFSDADWAACEESRKSTTGYVFKVGVGAVSWASKRQPTVALSTTEAEYMALSAAAREAVWMQRLFMELRFDAADSITINVDNQSCISLAKNPSFHARTKHIDIRHHFVREKVESGVVDLVFCPTKEMVADVLTKALPKEQHDWCARNMGLRKIDG